MYCRRGLKESTGGQVLYTALEEVTRRVRAGTVGALTTDVFDTIVWRKVPEPTDVFIKLGQALRDREALDPGLCPRSFAAVRAGGERASPPAADR